MKAKKEVSGIKHDDMLAFGGKPSLLYPAVRAPSEDDPSEAGPFPHRLARGLGTAKFLCGACLALLGGMAVYVQAWSAWMYGGIWSGLFAIFTGLCIILAARKHDQGLPQPRKSLLVALLILSILGFFNTGLLATFTAMGLVAEVYMENVAGALVWKGVENASPFTVQLLLLATATADCLLSLACCVISGRQVCCCGDPTPALVHRHKQDRLISWLGSQQDQRFNNGQEPAKAAMPVIRLVPSVRGTRSSRPRTPSTLRIFPAPPAPVQNGSSPASSTTTKQDTPLVKADELGRRASKMAQHTQYRPSASSISKNGHRGRKVGTRMAPDGELEPRPIALCINDKYFALDRQLSEEFIERSLVLERNRQSNV